MKTQISLRHKKVWNEWPGLNNCELCIKDPHHCQWKLRRLVYCGLKAIFKINQHITFIKKSLPGVTNPIIIQPYKEGEWGRTAEYFILCLKQQARGFMLPKIPTAIFDS